MPTLLDLLFLAVAASVVLQAHHVAGTTSYLRGFNAAELNVAGLDDGAVRLYADSSNEVFGHFRLTRSGDRLLERIEILCSNGAAINVGVSKEFPGALSLLVDGEPFDTTLYANLRLTLDGLDVTIVFDREHYTGQEAMILSTPGMKLVMATVASTEAVLSFELRVPSNARHQDIRGLLGNTLALAEGDSTPQSEYLTASYGDGGLMNPFVNELALSVGKDSNQMSVTEQQDVIPAEETAEDGDFESDPFEYHRHLDSRRQSRKLRH